MADKFQHKKSLGQNFLNSDYVPKQMCDAAGDITGETVLEIGPGTGALTAEILARGATVIALEADVRAMEHLQARFTEAITNGKLILHHGDARELDPAQFGLENHSYIVISNIPYYLSGLLLRRLLDTTCQPTTLVFLIQKELAERIARDKKESLLSLSVKAFGQPRYVTTIKRGHFTPPPKVDSAIIAITDIDQNNFKTVTTEEFFTLLHHGFGQKRKQLMSTLAKTGEWKRDFLINTFADIGLPATVRAEDIPLDTWFSLAIHLFSTNPHGYSQ